MCSKIQHRRKLFNKVPPAAAIPFGISEILAFVQSAGKENTASTVGLALSKVVVESSLFFINFYGLEYARKTQYMVVFMAQGDHSSSSVYIWQLYGSFQKFLLRNWSSILKHIHGSCGKFALTNPIRCMLKYSMIYWMCSMAVRWRYRRSTLANNCVATREASARSWSCLGAIPLVWPQS